MDIIKVLLKNFWHSSLSIWSKKRKKRKISCSKEIPRYVIKVFLFFTWLINCKLQRWNKLLKHQCLKQHCWEGWRGVGRELPAIQCIESSEGPEVVSTWFKAEVEFLHSSSSGKDEWAFIMDLAVTMGINDHDHWVLSRMPRDSIYAKSFILSLEAQPWIITDSRDAVKVKVTQTIDNNKF